VQISTRAHQDGLPPRGRLDGLVLTADGYGNTPRWRPGDRLEGLYEARCDWLAEQGRADHLAVDAGHVRLTYAELDARANQLARFLRRQGVAPGDRIGLLFDAAVDSYTGMLAVLKAGAAYVPLDAGFPADRLAFIASDAGLRLILTCSHLASPDSASPDPASPDPASPDPASSVPQIYLDGSRDLIAAELPDRLEPGEVTTPADDLCYVVYTSGTTGQPKGVAITHASICNFVAVAAEVYGMVTDDRVYQGMTIAFDFSVEEIWVPWASGATLVPKPGRTSLLGGELDRFLTDQQVTALCCVPTLLSTLDSERAGLRLLLVSGESCPQDLVARWHRDGRRFLNVYGPTEATVTATWTVLHPDRRVTIGVPLPTYSAVILDPAADQSLPPGELGEIGLAGIGLASGYLNRPELTERAFIADFLGIGDNPAGRIYRTGDLGRINPDGEIEHHGRIDTQVKIRGYRVELTEIESALLALDGIGQAAVDVFHPEPDVTELAAYYSPSGDGGAPEADRVYEYLSGRLPSYMVPAYLTELPVLPMLPSDKVDRRRLPAPTARRRLSGRGQHVPPAEGTERELAGLLAEVLQLDQVSAESHFFDDLGADSLLMARFSAAVRDRDGLPAVSMKDVYLHPTVRRLAAAGAPAETAAPATPARAEPAPVEPAPVEPAPVEPALPRRASQASYLRCGILQLLAFAGYVYLAAVWLDTGANWIAGAGRDVPALYGRLVAVGGGALVAMAVLPIGAKWLLVGRWKPADIRVWSLGYFRFWLVKTLVMANPLARMFVGTPLYNLYLRALGARVGRGAVIFTPHLPVCTDLLTIGAGAVIRKDSYLNGYRARSGVIETGAVTVGAGAFVGEETVLDIGTVLGDGAQLGHSSALHAGQVVPAGQVWHGSPAQPAGPGCVYLTVPPARCGAVRRAVTSVTRLVLALAVLAPLEMAVAVLLLSRPMLIARLVPGSPGALTAPVDERDALVISVVAFCGLLVAGLPFVATVPRLLAAALQPGRVYPLYGLHYLLQRTVSALSNARFFNYLFGDTSAVVYYLRAIGYRLTPLEQTGSNFGMEVKHEVPGLSQVGTGTMVSDGLSFVNAEFSSTSFRVLPTTIGQRNFLGNNIVYPAGGRTGDDCLLATKAMVPVSGPVREGVGLLGSPCFEIPRSVRRDHQFDHLSAGPERRRRLAAKNRHNAATAGLYLLVRWIFVFGLVLNSLLLAGPNGHAGAAQITAIALLDVCFTVAYFALVERALTRFRPLQPAYCSVYQREFWRHERFWKVPATVYLQLFNGTPAKGMVWRLLGVQIGRRVFDDGCHIVERTLTRVGSDCTLGIGTTIQGHSLEDGTFKSGPITIGTACTIGTGAFVHYGVTMGDGAVLDTDSFLMKGEHVSPHAQWRGNPAAAS
jgi:non-ribosomal peptide synthetase-like protein